MAKPRNPRSGPVAREMVRQSAPLERTYQCTRCGLLLPLAAFDFMASGQPRRICRLCIDRAHARRFGLPEPAFPQPSDGEGEVLSALSIDDDSGVDRDEDSGPIIDSAELREVLRLQKRMIYWLKDLTLLVEQQQRLTRAIEALTMRIAALEAKK